MKNTYQKGASAVIVIILILIGVAIGLYFYTVDRADDAKEGMVGENESSEVNEVNDEDESVGFEEEPKNLPVTDTQSGGTPTNPNIPVVTEEPIIGANVGMKGFAFAPATVTIKAGQSVEWVNDDSAPHTVTSTTGLFDSGNESPGNIYTHKFDKPGTYTYVCSYHPNMKGTVIVTE